MEPYNTFSHNDFHLSSPLTQETQVPFMLAITSWERFGLFPVRSPLLREWIHFSFPPNVLCGWKRKVNNTFSFPLGTEMFHFPRLPPCTYVFSTRSCGIPRMGFPHSDIFGSKVACHLPEAYRRLLRPSSACSVEPSSVCSYWCSTTAPTFDISSRMRAVIDFLFHYPYLVVKIFWCSVTSFLRTRVQS